MTVAIVLGSCSIGIGATSDVAHSIEEWISVVQNEAMAEEKAIAGTEYELIRLGASICGANHPGKSDKNYSPRWRDSVGKFKAFMQERGLALTRKWRKGETLSDDEKKYLPIVEFIYFSHARKDHRDATQRLFVGDFAAEEIADAEAYRKQCDLEAKKLLTELYRQGAKKVVASRELESLRRFHRAEATDCVMGIDYLPFMLGIGPLNRHKPTPGFEGLDFRLPLLETVLKSPAYTDEPPIDFAIVAPLRKDGILEVLNALAGYEVAADGKVVSNANRLATRPEEQAAGFFRLSDFKGKKPVVVIMPDAVDCFWPMAFVVLEPIYQAYRNSVDFVVVNVTIHDLHMSPPNEFFARVPTGYASFDGHPYSVEERARTAKNVCMAHPFATVPWVLDDVASTSNNDFMSNGGSAGIRIIDKNGALAEYTDAAFENVLWANELEISLQELIANGGKMPTGKVFLPVLPRAALERKQRLTLTLPAGMVDEVSNAGCAIKHPMISGDKTYNLAAGPFTRVARSGRPCKVSELRKGDKVEVRFWADTYYKPPLSKTFTIKASEYRGPVGEYDLKSGGGVVAKVKTYDGSGYMWEGWHHSHLVDDPGTGVLTPRRIEVVSTPPQSRIWFCGRVRGLDETDRVVTVERQKPRQGGMRGYAFWKQSPRAKMTPAVADQMKVIENWMSAPGDTIVRKVLIDDAVEMTLNGKFDAAFSDIKVGDFIGFEYYAVQDDVAAIRPEQARLSRRR